MGIIHQMHDLHVTGRSTLCWYYLYSCMLWDWHNISDCDCQHGISYYPIYCSRLGVSVWIVSAEFGSPRFCWVHFSLFLCLSVVHGEFHWRICSTLLFAQNFGTNLRLVLSIWNLYWDLNLRLGTWIENLDLQLGLTHLWRWSSFYNCHTSTN